MNIWVNGCFDILHMGHIDLLWFAKLYDTEEHSILPPNKQNRLIVGIDSDGKIAFDFGVFGLPETFIINKDRKIIYKHTGPLTKKIIENEIANLF